MAFGDGLQLHFTQTQFATQSAPTLSQMFSEHIFCNVKFGWKEKEWKLNDMNKANQNKQFQQYLQDLTKDFYAQHKLKVDGGPAGQN